MNLKKVYIETYGCQMNISDSEIVAGIMADSGDYTLTEDPAAADVIFLNTCSVRDNAEQTIFKRLKALRQYSKQKPRLVVGILGCMAERLQQKLLGERDIVSIVAGPDEYRQLPALVTAAFTGKAGIAVELSKVETYEDITPLRMEGISAWISVMRGCNNFCSYCVVPYTRGRERSRSFDTIIAEVKRLYDNGFKEITLLGQNVNSYADELSGADFADLLDAIAAAVPNMRIRYTTSHPRDMSDKLLETMARHVNICKHIHVAMQSGSDVMLEKMNRRYTAAHFLGRVRKIKELMPECTLSTDIIAGFPTETIEDHEATLELMSKIRFEGAFMFKYSPREGTKSFLMDDDVPEEEKIRRLNEIIALENEIARELNAAEIGKVREVLAEGRSKKSKNDWMGRTSGNKVVIFPNRDGLIMAGDFVNVRITSSTSATLIGEVVA